MVLGDLLTMGSLGYQTILQNGFLDIILTMDTSKLRKPLDPDILGTAFTSTEYAPTKSELSGDTAIVLADRFRDPRSSNTNRSRAYTG